MEKTDQIEEKNNSIWKQVMDIKGDKVILIIILLLLLISFLAIFSSTPLLPAQENRLATMKDQGIIVMLGIGLMALLYKINVRWIKPFTQFGFALSLVMLTLLVMRIDWGFIKTQTINGALRNFYVFGLQIHVFEVVKVAMVLYLAWAMNAINEDKKAMSEKKHSRTLWIANRLAEDYPKLGFLKKTFWKRAMYIYIPTLIICSLVFLGSGSSAIFIGVILIATMIIGGVPLRELIIAGICMGGILLGLIGIHKASDGKLISRAGTMLSRLDEKYDMDRLNAYEIKSREYYDLLDDLRQPVSAKIAVHQGGWLGKGTGNSTQKYHVENIYGDYMYSFLVEEYGLLGGIFILILYVSLLARSSIIARMCDNEFAKYVLGGLAILITGQAFMHILVNVDIGPMTGQTLPLISHGASAFLVFCVAFGLILSISRMAKKKMMKVEEKTEASVNTLEANIEAAERLKE